eukprot:CAMPEP_0197290688 /NCGR_PEP_ID=MMETSP0890-20130614/9010_1 /TAXON_ID=44058 ORGANISM="Aureoumbra lagunensis, Strain CCMP1510" /NCGR_SAMPLE_ID=MMETSP0890 /ASSEMBLY_ACC=CAM_ASM_000533 /LENGTH=113 /DNA_ID=CAMNT_0042762875 /DNA_START=313 /DNA_END=654 /DNA_ORIENTATION=+
MSHDQQNDINNIRNDVSTISQDAQSLTQTMDTTQQNIQQLTLLMQQSNWVGLLGLYLPQRKVLTQRKAVVLDQYLPQRKLPTHRKAIVLDQQGNAQRPEDTTYPNQLGVYTET